MSQFKHLWDREAGLLLAACDLRDVGDNALLIVEGPGADGAHGIQAIVPVEKCDQNVGNTVILPVPDEDFVGLRRFDFRVFGRGHDAHDGAFPSDSVILDGEVGGADHQVPADSWSVHDGGKEPYLSIIGSDQQVDPQLISRVFLSRRDGDRLGPATLGDGAGEGGSLELIATIEDFPASEIPVHIPDAGSDHFDDHVVSLRIRQNSVMLAAEMNLRVYTLIAGRHVVRLLQEPETELVPEDNLQSLRLNARSDEAKTEFPRLESADDGSQRIVKGTHALGFLDRIVVESRPPAQFTFFEDGLKPRKIGRNGVAVLSLLEGDRFVFDDGALLDRVAKNRSGVVRETGPDIVAGLSRHHLSVSRSDLKHATDVTAFLAAAHSKRIETRLGVSGRNLRPSGFGKFRAAPQFYCCLSGMEPEQLSLDTVARLRSASESMAVDRLLILGEGVLETIIDETRDNAWNSSGAEIERLRLWLDSGMVDSWQGLAAAFSEKMRATIGLGVVPGPDSIELTLGAAESDLVRRLTGLLQLLTDAGVIEFSAEEQLTEFSRIRARLRELEALRDSAYSAIRDVNAHLGGLVELDPQPANGLKDLIAVNSDLGAEQEENNRAVSFLTERISEGLPQAMAQNGSVDFARNAARKLYDGIHFHYKKISRIVASGFKDPIDLESDKIIPLGGKFSEPPASSFNGPLSDDLVDWINSDDPVPPPVEKWRRSLREEYNEKKQFRRDGQA